MLALILVSAGIYGLLSYVLSLRRKEIGIRMALGADAPRMTRSILRDGLIVTDRRDRVGLAGAIASVPLIRRLLVNDQPVRSGRDRRGVHAVAAHYHGSVARDPPRAQAGSSRCPS